MNVVIVAHYDINGALEDDLCSFLNYLALKDFHVFLVSTGLRVENTTELNEGINVLIRDNYGYDFYSYAEGFKKNIDMINVSKNIILMNSSFKIISADKLFHYFECAVDDQYQNIDLLSLTESNENSFHCQSFLMRFNNKLISSRRFLNWWLKMKPLNKRQKVIDKYELGLTKFVQKEGFVAGSVLNIDLDRKSQGMKLYKDIYGRVTDYTKLNPCHFMWEALLDDFGVIKYELLNKNPHGLKINIPE